MGGQAFDAPRLQAFYLDPSTVTVLCLDTKDGEEHPLWDPRFSIPVDQSDIDSVMTYGVLTVGIVRKEKMADGSERTVVIDGRQRTRWARAANDVIRAEVGEGKAYDEKKILVPYYVVKNQSEEKIARMIIAANHHKETPPLMKAQLAKQRLDRGHSMKDVAIAFGVTPQAVTEWVRGLSLSAKMRGAVDAGTLSFSTAIQYDDLAPEKQDEILSDMERLGVKIGTGEAKAQRAARKRTNGSNGHDVRRPVGMATVRKVIADEEFMGGLDPITQAVLKWVVGEPNQDRRVPGLRACERRVGFLGENED